MEFERYLNELNNNCKVLEKMSSRDKEFGVMASLCRNVVDDVIYQIESANQCRYDIVDAITHDVTGFNQGALVGKYFKSLSPYDITRAGIDIDEMNKSITPEDSVELAAAKLARSIGALSGAVSDEVKRIFKEKCGCKF